MFIYLKIFIFTYAKKSIGKMLKATCWGTYLVTVSPSRLLQVGLESGSRQLRTPGHFDFVGADLWRETHKVKIDKLEKTQILHLIMPNCETFDRSDLHDFYTIKSLREGDFRVKIEFLKLIFSGSFWAAKFLTRMLRQILMSAVPSKHAEQAHQEPMRTLSIRVRNWCVRWA
jgi:hypothetical protein